MTIINDDISDCKTFTQLRSHCLNSLLVHQTAIVIARSTSPFKKPFQFHTGLGDNDITLTKSSPSHLQDFIRHHPTVPIVLLHGGYPWTREMGYLATHYANVYADIGEIFPIVSRHGQEAVLRQILELCPWTKILWSTDGHWFPETYALAIAQARIVFKSVSVECVCIPGASRKLMFSNRLLAIWSVTMISLSLKQSSLCKTFSSTTPISCTTCR